MPYHAGLVTPAKRHTPPDQPAVHEDDLDGPVSEVETARAEALDSLAHLLELGAIELRDP